MSRRQHVKSGGQGGGLSALALGALWFGAAISLAEVWSGGLLAGLGLGPGLAVNLLGHLAGGLLFILAAWPSARQMRPAMAVLDTVLGPWGPRIFGLANGVQLLGWTAVMLITGAQAMAVIVSDSGLAVDPVAWKLLLGLVLLLWTSLGLRGLKGLNLAAVVLLLGLTVWVAFALGTRPAGLDSAGDSQVAREGPGIMAWGQGLEWVIIMPLSWLPLVGDYVCRGQSRRTAGLASAVGYAAGSSWMFACGLLGVMATGQADPALWLGACGAGWVAMAVIILSTVTTACLNVHSAVLSFQAVATRPAWPSPSPATPAGTEVPGGTEQHQPSQAGRTAELVGTELAAQASPVNPGKPVSRELPVWPGLLVALAGIGLGLCFPMDQYQGFLYAIGAVFAPLYGVVIAAWLAPAARQTIEPASRLAMVWAFACCALGTGLYYLLSVTGSPLGMSLPAMFLSGLAYRAGLPMFRRRPIPPGIPDLVCQPPPTRLPDTTHQS